MVAIESTPEFVSGVYARMEAAIQALRDRLDRPMGLADKLLLSHLDDTSAESLDPGSSYLMLRPDRVALQDVLGQTVMLQFMQTRRESTAVPTTVHCDHLIQARSEGGIDLLQSVEENSEVYDFLKSAAAKYGAGFWAPGAGIIHQVILEEYAFPGALIIGTDSHTPNAGGLGACAVGVGGADAVEVMAGLPWEVLYPRRVGVRLTGEMSGWTAPKDVILFLAGELTVAGGTNSIIEYFGPGTRSISCTGKATITNMGAELGATTSVFPYDERMERYLRATRRGALADLANQHKDILSVDDAVEADPEGYFDRVVEIDLSKLEPHVVGPHTPDRARPISQLAEEVRDDANSFVDDIDTSLIGSCTNSSYEDMSRAADVARQAGAHGVEAGTPFMVTPGSEQVRATIERDGQMDALKSIGATVLANACGPCIGQWRREKVLDGVPNTIVTSYNRNFPRRNDGRSETMNFIASPEVVTAMSIAGRLSFNPLQDSLTGSDGEAFMLEAPGPAPEVPPKDFARGRSFFIAPRTTGPPSRSKSTPTARGSSSWSRGPRGTATTTWTCRCWSRSGASAPPTTSRPPGRGCGYADTSTSSATTCSWARRTPSPAKPARAATRSPERTASPSLALPAATRRKASAGSCSATRTTARAAAASMRRCLPGSSEERP